MSPEWVGVEEVAAKLGKSPYMIREHAKRRRFGYAARKIGRLWFFHLGKLDDFLAGVQLPMRTGRPRKPVIPAGSLDAIRIAVPRVQR